MRFRAEPPVHRNKLYFLTFVKKTISCLILSVELESQGPHSGGPLGRLGARGAYSFKPSAGIAGKCTQNRLQISPIYVSAPNSPLLWHTKCTLQRCTQRPKRVEQ